MVRAQPVRAGRLLRSPHPRGDGPQGRLIGLKVDMFSPPAWGWSENDNLQEWLVQVLPTRVGMVRALCQQ